jgi:hypothetical protein
MSAMPLSTSVWIVKSANPARAHRSVAPDTLDIVDEEDPPAGWNQHLRPDEQPRAVGAR